MARKVGDIKNLLRETSHNGFPVVRNTTHGGVFVGLITRGHLMVLLRAVAAGGSTEDVSVSYAELKQRNVTARARRVVSEQCRELLIGTNGEQRDDNSSEELLDLGMYINRSAMKARDLFASACGVCLVCLNR